MKRINWAGQKMSLSQPNQCNGSKSGRGKQMDCCSPDYPNQPVVKPKALKEHQCAVMAASAADIAHMRQCAAVPFVETNCYPGLEGWDNILPPEDGYNIVVAPPPYNIAPPGNCTHNW